MYQNAAGGCYGVGVSVVVRFKGYAGQRELLAFGAHGQHRRLNGSGPYFLAEIVPFRVEYGGEDVLRGAPITAGLLGVVKLVYLDNVLYFLYGLNCAHDGACFYAIGKRYAVIVRV